MTRRDYYNLLSEYQDVLIEKEFRINSSGLNNRLLQIKDSLLRQLKSEKRKLLRLMPEEGLYGNSNIISDFKKIIFEKRLRKVCSLISKIEKEEQIQVKDFENTYYSMKISDYLPFG